MKSQQKNTDKRGKRYSPKPDQIVSKPNTNKLYTLCKEYDLHKILPKPGVEFCILTINLPINNAQTLTYANIIAKQGEIRYKRGYRTIYEVPQIVHDAITNLVENKDRLSTEKRHSQVPNSLNGRITKDKIESALSELETITNEPNQNND